MSKTTRVVAVGAILMGLVMVTLSVPVEAVPRQMEFFNDPDLNEVEELKYDIHILNLLNVLYLTPDQIDGLLEVHDRRKDLFYEVKEHLIGNSEQAKSAFMALRHALLSGRSPEERVTRLAQQSNRGMKEFGFESLDKYKDLAREAEDLLNESQKVIVEHYVSCLIPPQNAINPLRIGQSGGDKRGRKMLERVRQMSDDTYRQRKGGIVDRVYGRMEKMAKGRPNSSLDGVRQKVGEMLDNVRAMSDTDFKLYDGKSGKELLVENQKPKKDKKMVIRPKIMKFILHPRAEILLRQLQSMQK